MTRFSKRLFKEPENVYWPGYFWIINGKMDVGELCRQLDDMAAHGAKSVCFHPFPKRFRPVTMPSTMEPDYMTPEYMDIVAKVIDHAEKLGMNAWLYDEGGWPSGGCCGQVWASNPDKFAIRRKVLKDDGRIEDDVIKCNPDYCAPVPSVIEPGVTDKFIELTHEKWRKSMARHFGKTLKFTFTDEPNMQGYYPEEVMTWCSDFDKVFKAAKGYSIIPHLSKLLHKGKTTPEMERVRIDYCDVRANLFRDRFLRPIRKWCRENGLLSGGHLNGEDEPKGNTCYGYGHILRSLRELDVPGVDVIWRQLYPGKKDNRPFPKYASSAANQNGSKYVLSESFAIYGDNTTPDIMKWLIDYQLVRGINLFVFGYSFYQSKGMFMDGIVPNYSEKNTIWDFMGPLYKYAARIGSVLSNGSPAQKTAVLYDIHSIWAGGKTADRASDLHLKTSQKMLEEQRDFDFIDVEQIEKGIITADGCMKIGKMSYSTIVITGERLLSDAAIRKLEEFSRAGGLKLDSIALQKVPRICKVTGRGRKNIRVIKRLYDGKAAYFFVNESPSDEVFATIELDEKDCVALCDPDTGEFAEVKSSNGKFKWHFEPFESALFMTGVPCDSHAESASVTDVTILEQGWTMRKLASYRAGECELEVIHENAKAIPTDLGDWRTAFGDEFSGKVLYAVNVECDEDKSVLLDLGRVCYCASVSVNGIRQQPKFFGPFTYFINLKKGVNRIEVTVANTMANALGQPEIRQRIIDKFPPKSPYDDRLAKFDKESHESGLFGPVRILTLQ